MFFLLFVGYSLFGCDNTTLPSCIEGIFCVADESPFTSSIYYSTLSKLHGLILMGISFLLVVSTMRALSTQNCEHLISSIQMNHSWIYTTGEMIERRKELQMGINRTANIHAMRSIHLFSILFIARALFHISSCAKNSLRFVLKWWIHIFFCFVFNQIVYFSDSI